MTPPNEPLLPDGGRTSFRFAETRQFGRHRSLSPSSRRQFGRHRASSLLWRRPVGVFCKASRRGTTARRSADKRRGRHQLFGGKIDAARSFTISIESMFGWNTVTPEEKAARTALRSGDLQAAYLSIAPLLEYPGNLPSDKLWSSAWKTFAEVAKGIAGPVLANQARSAASHPKNPNVLYELGYSLIEHGLHGPAATVLTRALDQQPAAEPILTELVCALEGLGLNEVAVDALEKSGLANTSFIFRYLLSFNKLMCGSVRDSIASAEGLSELAAKTPTQILDFQFMESALRDMHHRATLIEGHTTLEPTDLRGWTYVINNCLLLHLSEYGFDEGMNGRYAFVQESPELLAEGIYGISKVAPEYPAVPQRILALPDRDSEILARVAAAALRYDLAEWSPDRAEEPGILVCYDFATVDPETLDALTVRHPAQLLWCHACTWTQGFPLAPDVITYLHQHTTPPWGGFMKVDPETKQLTNEPALSGTCPAVASRVGDMLPKLDDIDELDLLPAFARRITAGNGALYHASSAEVSKRNMFRTDSPVKSNKFR